MINKYIDHTLLKANASSLDILNLCNEAKEYDFMSVCINPYFVSFAKEQLQNTNVLVCTVISFPLGANTISQKVASVLAAIKDGADEIDYVINISVALEHNYDYIKKEAQEIIKVAGGRTVKAILENCYFNKAEIAKLSQVLSEAKISYVKTSTGFASGGATIEDVKIMRQNVASNVGVKASGGIRSYQDALTFIHNGASRIGTSGGVAIVKQDPNKEDY